MEPSNGALCEVVRVENKRGLHARAAAKFVRLADSFISDISVARGEISVSGRSIMGLMMLAASCGTELKLCVSGDDALQAMEALASLVKRKFDED